METSESMYPQIGVAMTSRSFPEYVAMFEFDEHQLQGKRILDVAAGASSFVAECLRRGMDATAVDPLYHLSPDEMVTQGQGEIQESTQKLARLVDYYRWDYYGDLARHRAGREQSLQRFAAAYATHPERYVMGQLPHLPFADNVFSLVICNHFLFLYHDQFDLDFHQGAIAELIRVCSPGGEVMVYPLSTLAREGYPHVEEILHEVRQRGCSAALRETAFRFLPTASHVLHIRKPSP